MLPSQCPEPLSQGFVVWIARQFRATDRRKHTTLQARRWLIPFADTSQAATSRKAAVFGIDIGNTFFHVVGLDAAGMPIQKAAFRRETLLQFFARASPALVRMEACPG